MKQILTSIFIVLLSSTHAYCQKKALIIDEVFEETPIAEVFDLLREKYQLRFAYDYASVQDVKVSRIIDAQNLESALSKIFASTNLEYQLVEDNRVLVRKVDNYTLGLTTEKLRQYILKGKIIDAKSKQPLEYANVFCESTNTGCSTDEQGNFSLSLKTSQTTGKLTIQYLGYIPSVIYWKEGEDLANLNVALQAKSLEFKEVQILEKLPAISLNQEDGAILLRASQLPTLPSFIGGNDIFRSIQLMPGISASDDLSAELKIRGSNGDENMVVLDGITLYKVDHYFGIFSAINSNIINQVEVYKNAFPVEYGGRTAGVIDLSTGEAAQSKIGGGVEINLLTSSAHIALPISDNMGLLIGARITNKNVANTDLFSVLDQENRTSTILDEEDDSSLSHSRVMALEPEFKFYDVNAKWQWNMKPHSSLSASFFRGYDEFKYNYERVFTNIGRRGKKIVNEEHFDEVADWKNQGLSLRLNHQWKKNLTSDINLAYSTYKDEQHIDATLIRVDEKKSESESPSSSEYIDTNYNISNNNFNNIEGVEFNVKNEWDVDKRQKLTFGYHLVKNHVDFELNVDKRIALNKSQDAAQHAAYLQYDVKVFDKLHIGLGLRNTYYSLTTKNYLSPRINVSYKVIDNLKLKTSWSKYHQFLRRNYREDQFGRTYEFWVLGDDKGFPTSSSEQWMAGFNFLHDLVELDMEFYHKSIDGVTEYALQTTGFNPEGGTSPKDIMFKLFYGTGTYKGMDLLLKKSSGNYTGWAAYTLSKMTHRFRQIDKGRPFPAQDDRRHQLKWINQYRYKKFDFSATYIYSTGRPYTDLSFFDMDPQDRTELTETDRIAYLEDYHRIDIGGSYRFDWGDFKGRVGVSIFNLFNRKNVKYRQYIYALPEQENQNTPARNTIIGAELQMLDFTPNIRFSLEF